MGGYVNGISGAQLGKTPVGHSMLLPEEFRIESMRLWAEGETKNCLNFLESNLQGKDYLLDEFSLADISVGYLLFLVKISRNGKLMGEATKAYFERLSAREAWSRASALTP